MATGTTKSCSTKSAPSTQQTEEFCQVEQLSAISESSCEITKCEDQIRETAYLLWEAAGYPESDGVDFWLQAEKSLYGE